MRRTTMLLFLFMLLYGFGFAQDHWKFRSMNYLGLLVGATEPALEVHSINGFSRKNWFAGIGLGFDSYRFESYPVYVSVGKEFRKNRLSLVLSADAGGNFSEYSPGFYGRTGLGLKVYLPSGKSAFLVDLGYSYKQVIEHLTEREQSNYEFSRISSRIGWQF
jgi:hypothetical protein